MPMETSGVIKLVSVGSVFSAVLAFFGVKKMIKQELCEIFKDKMVAVDTRMSGVDREIKELKLAGATYVDGPQQERICSLKSELIDSQIKNVETQIKAISEEVKSVKSHIDSKFEDLNERWGQRK
jgi:chaperonin cofactor prefoldin